MIVYYRLLVFEPISNEATKDEHILWKAQLEVFNNYSSLQTIMISDWIELSNRRSIKDWIRLFDENSFEYYINFESEYCLEYIIYEKGTVNYSIQLFACDIRATTNILEFSEDVIMPLLFILDLKKEGKINPVALKNRISLAHDRIVPDSINLLISSNLKALERLCDLCIDYETDLSFKVKTVTDK